MVLTILGEGDWPYSNLFQGQLPQAKKLSQVDFLHDLSDSLDIDREGGRGGGWEGRQGDSDLEKELCEYDQSFMKVDSSGQCNLVVSHEMLGKKSFKLIA